MHKTHTYYLLVGLVLAAWAVQVPGVTAQAATVQMEFRLHRW
jgi:hypothetical protein